MTIRDADYGDITKIVARGIWHHEELKIPWAFDELSAAQSVLALVRAGTLLVTDNVAGYIGYELGPMYFNHDVIVAKEHFWYVLPSERKTGLGMALLEAARTKAKKQGATWFSVQLPQESKRAIELVEKEGYQLMHGEYGVAL